MAGLGSVASLDDDAVSAVDDAQESLDTSEDQLIAAKAAAAEGDRDLGDGAGTLLVRTAGGSAQRPLALDH